MAGLTTAATRDAGTPAVAAPTTPHAAATTTAGPAPVDDLSAEGWDRGPAPVLSVVVATRNRARWLSGLLDALAAQTLGADRFEVVVVDDGSTDGTWDVLRHQVAVGGLRLRVLRLARSEGQGEARNAGVARTRTDILCFTDDDCVPDPGWLAALAGPLLAPGAPAVVVQGRTEGWAGDRDGAGPWGRTVWVTGPSWLFETCNIAYRRADWVAAGGFPGRRHAEVTAGGKAVGEDALLGWRVTGAGVDLRFCPEAVVGHRHHPAGYRSWLAAHTGKADFPALVARDPAGRRALWHRWWLAPRTAAAEAALVSVTAGAAARRPAWLLGALPWLALLLPEARHRSGPTPLRLVQVAAGDLVAVAALVAGSVRHRTVVL